HTENMKPWRRAGGMLASGAVTLFVLALAPAVLLAGELENRHYLGRPPAARDRILVRGQGRGVEVQAIGPRRTGFPASGRDHRVARRGAAHPPWDAPTPPPRVALPPTTPRAGRAGGAGPGR